MIGLEYIMKNYNYSSSQLTKDLNIAKQNISRWFNGKRTIPNKYIPILAKKFNVNESYISIEITNDNINI